MPVLVGVVPVVGVVAYVGVAAVAGVGLNLYWVAVVGAGGVVYVAGVKTKRYSIPYKVRPLYQTLNP